MFNVVPLPTSSITGLSPVYNDYLDLTNYGPLSSDQKQDDVEEAVTDLFQQEHEDPWGRGIVAAVTSPGVRGVSSMDHHVIITPENDQSTGEAHEIGHQIGFIHADTRCGGNADGQKGYGYPPDDEGLLHGVGVSIQQLADLPAGTQPNIIGSRSMGAPAHNASEVYDYMSYCTANDQSAAWASVPFWNDFLQSQAAIPPSWGAFSTGLGIASGARVQRALPLFTSGGFEPSGPGPAARGPLVRGHKTDLTVILHGDGSLSPGLITATSQPLFAPTGTASGYSLTARAADGRSVATAPLLSTPLHVHGDDEQELSALLPLAASVKVSSAVIDHDGHAVWTRTAPSQAPNVHEPHTAHHVLHSDRPVAVSWKLRPAPGAPLPTVSLEVSSNNGRTWFSLASGPALLRAVIPAHRLTPSAHTRFRVTVTDGFHEVVATGPQIRVLAAPPIVQILSPARGQTVQDIATTTLQGAAYGVRGRLLPARWLRWLLDGHSIGQGAMTSVTGLPAGRRRLTRQASDHGLIARRTISLRVLATPPRAIVLSVPHRISIRADAITLAIRTAAPALLQSGRTDAPVGTRLHRVRLLVSPGRRPLRLVVSLRSGPFRTAYRLTVRRGAASTAV